MTHNRNTLATLVVMVGTGALATACQGSPFEEPPIHIIPNMDYQQKYEAQEHNEFFADGRGMRAPVEGTVARGHLKADDHLWKGRGLDGRLVDELPPTIEYGPELLERGEARYDIYCSPCHDNVGTGHGPVTTRGGGFQVQPANLHAERLRPMPLGHFYDVITNGKGTMLPYAAQIPVEDRWAIAVWVRALQIHGERKGFDDQTTTMTQVAAAPAEEAAATGDEGKAEAAKEQDNG